MMRNEEAARTGRHLAEGEGPSKRGVLPLAVLALLLVASVIGALYAHDITLSRRSAPAKAPKENRLAAMCTHTLNDRGVGVIDQWMSDFQARKASLSGWVEAEDGAKRFFDEESHEPYRGWHVIEDKTYCFDDSGLMLTGWAVGEDGKARWLKPEDGTMATHEWVEIEGFWEPFDDDGSWVNESEVIPDTNAVAMEQLSARQKNVIDACDRAPWPGKGLCAAWVSSVFGYAGEPAVGGNACDIARTWCTSDDLSQLEPGMVIAVASHSRTENGKIWGHVCVYVGDGVVRDSGTYGIRRIRLGSWLAWFGVDEQPKWGWANGIELV